MDQDITKLAKACSRQAMVVPQWLPCSNSVFWYRRETGSENFEFIFVDCEKGIREKAFDHAALASELAKHATCEVNPERLPFWWINIDESGDCVRFQFNDKTWQYTKKCKKLEEWDGEFVPWGFGPGEKETPSPEDTESGAITFKNHTLSDLKLLWINGDGGTQSYNTVPMDGTRRVRSYIGHVWRLELDDSDKKVVCVVKKETPVVTIEEAPGMLGIRYDKSSETDQEEEGTDKKFEPFIRDFNLWTRPGKGKSVSNDDSTDKSESASSNKERQISFGGVLDNQFKRIYQTAEGNHAVVWQCRQPSKRQLHFVESCPEDQMQPKLTSRTYLKPGDEVEMERPRLFDLSAGKEIPVDDALFRNPYALTNIGWSEDSQSYRFIFNERGHKIVRLLSISRDGTVTTLAEECSNTFVDYAQKTYHKVMKHELLWTSERDGWNHLYLFDAQTGTLKNQVTSGEWVVRSVESVDEEKRQIWFQGLGMIPGQDLYYPHLACVNFDGSCLRVITDADGVHTWKWGPDRRFLIATWSRVDSSPESVVQNVETGKKSVTVEKGDLKPLLDAGWVAPERFVAKGRDGTTDIHGVIVRPKDMDETKRYPVLENIYAGPQNFYAPKAFESPNKYRRVADQGYIVVSLDGMGTNWRSKAFHNVCYKNLKDAGFPDRIRWIKAAAETRSWMDLDRVGLYGSSAGGQNAAAAVLHHSDFYKVASAAAGCHDNRLDKMWWNELWMGYPVDESYHESSNMTHAHKLGGKLLLTVGELDTNVDPATTLRLADALIKAEKDFDMVFVPGGGHHVISTPFAQRKQDEFLKKHLIDC